MTQKITGVPDKNLQNVVKDLEQVKVNAHHAQQVQQDTNDRRHQDRLNDEGDNDQEGIR